MATREEQLFEAAETGDLETVRRLIHNGGVNIEWKNPTNGNTALHIATIKGHIPVVDFLIKNGANVNAKANYGTTPLHCATYTGGNLPIVELLLENGANPNIQDINMNTPFHVAVQSGNTEIVRAMVVGGADSTIRDGSYIGNARQIAQVKLQDAETEQKRNQYRDILKIIDESPTSRINTINTMYAVKEGLNPHKNVFNQIDASDWKEFHELSGKKGQDGEYSGGRKRRTKRRKSNRKRNSNKRRKSNKRRTLKRRKTNKRRKQRGGRTLLTTMDRNLLCERIRGVFNSYDNNGNIRYMGLQELKTILYDEHISDTILPIWDDGNDPSQLDRDIQYCINDLLNDRIILRDNNTNLLFRNQNLQM
jgi:hypothetical protein